MVKLKQLLENLEALWPLASADEWDKPGLSVGSRSQQIKRVLLTVDVTSSVIQEASEKQCELVISHHPLLLRGVTELTQESLKGQIVQLAIKNDIAIYSAHTNADKSEQGTAFAIADSIGLQNLMVLDDQSGHGLTGELKSAESLISFATRLAKRIPAVAAGVKVAGNPEQLVRTIGIAPGAGDAFLGVALQKELDVFITSDLRHHPAQDYIESPGGSRALIDISHWAAESLWLPLAQAQINRLHPELEVLISELRTDPWNFAVMQ